MSIRTVDFVSMYYTWRETRHTYEY
jgi:hypothetical protein